jgi:hypothetical protein
VPLRFGQPRRQPSEQQVLTATQRRPHDPVDSTSRRWLHPPAATFREQLFTHPLGTALDLSDVVDQPRGQHGGIGNRAFPEAQCLTDLSPMEFAGASRPFIKRDLGRFHPDLTRHVINCGIGNFGTTARKPTPLGIKPQQQREPQFRRTTLARHERQLVSDECPTINQFVLVNLARHPWKLHPQPTHHAETGVCTW